MNMEQLALDFLKVTQSAALAVQPWIGRGKKNEADEAATFAMRQEFLKISIDGIVVIGEGELDEAPMLYIGEKLGTGNGPQLDIAVDPLEGTNLVATGQGNSIAVIAAAPQGALLHAPDMYMEKLAVGPGAAGVIDIDAPLSENLKKVAVALGKKTSDLTVMVQDRERHDRIITQIKEIGARVRLFQDGDVIGTIATAIEQTGVDVFMGIGGAPEGVIAAVALKCMGGEMQARLVPRNEAEFKRCLDMGLKDPQGCIPMNELIRDDRCIFAATGITSGMLLEGITQSAESAVTHSLVCTNQSGTLHYIHTVHHQLQREKAL